MLSIIGLTALMTLTGCDAEAVAKASSAIVLPAEEILLSAGGKAMLVGEKYSVGSLVTPLLASSAELVYESSDSSVATVDKKGVVSAKKQGHATIKVSSKDNPEVSAEMKLYVFKEQKPAKIKTRLKDLATYQEEHVEAPRKLKTHEVETRYLYRNNKLYHSMTEYADFILSKDDAYFYIGGRDTETKYYDSPEFRSYFGYHFYTDADYHSFLYHENDNVHNWCYVPTEFYLGTEATRCDVIYAMMGSFFISGSDLAEDTVTDSLCNDLLTDYAPYCKSGGFGNDGINEVYAAYSGGGGGTASATMEQNLDIPAGTKYSEKDIFSAYWYKGNVKYYNLHFVLTYTIDGDNYSLDINREYTYERDDEFSFELPDRTKYTEVRDVFDL